MLECGRHGTAADLSRAEGVTKSYFSRILRLTLLGPDIVESVLNGTQPRALALKILLKVPGDLGRPTRRARIHPRLLQIPNSVAVGFLSL